MKDDVSKIQVESAYHALKSANRLRRFLNSQSHELSKEYVLALIDMMKLTVFSVQTEIIRETYHGINSCLGRHNAGKRSKQIEPLKNGVEQIMRERLACGKSTKARDIWDLFKKCSSDKPYRLGEEFFAYMDSDETTIIVYKEDKKETKEIGKRKFDAIQKYRTEIAKNLRKEGITT